MKQSTITIGVQLDEQKVPENILWNATDSTATDSQPAKAMMVSFWDGADKAALRIDLWTKEMQVLEMDRFMYQVLRSLSQTYLKATQNKELAEEMARFAHYFGEKTEIIPQGE